MSMNDAELLRRRVPGVLSGAVTYRERIFSIPHKAIFAIGLHTGQALMMPESDLFIRFTLYGHERPTAPVT